jgi:hypothetical protein
MRAGFSKLGTIHAAARCLNTRAELSLHDEPTPGFLVRAAI